MPPDKRQLSHAGDTPLVDDIRLGAAIRAVRVRRKLRQCDLACAAGVSDSTISLVERGHGRKLSLDTIRRIGAAIDVRIEVTAWWRGGDLDRLLNRRHSLLEESVASFIAEHPGWSVEPEVSFSIFGERGVVDLLAWHAATGQLLVIEIKTQLVDINELLGTLDRKRRLAREIVASRGWKRRLAREIVASRGWKPQSVSAWLVVADTCTNRRHSREHAMLIRSRFPLDGRQLRKILRQPAAAGSGIAFWADSNRSGGRRRTIAAGATIRKVGRSTRSSPSVTDAVSSSIG